MVMKTCKILTILLGSIASVAIAADDPFISSRISAFARANVGNCINAGTGQDLVITALLKCGANTTTMRPIAANELRSGDVIDFRTCRASRGNMQYFNVPFQQWAIVESRNGDELIIEVQGYNGMRRVCRGSIRITEIRGQMFCYRPQTR